MKPVHYYAAASWYGLSQGLQSFINPFLPIYYSRSLGFTPSQIGLLAALRPWISAPAGSIAAALADRLGSHRFVLLFCFLAATGLQSAIAFVVTFPSQLALTLGISTVWTGASIIGDAAVMAASTHPGDYGRVRTWASVCWIIISPIAGIMNEKYGMKPSIAIYCLGSLLAVPAGYLLPLESLSREKTIPPSIKPAVAAESELEEPLLAAEEATLAPEAETETVLRPPSPFVTRRAAEVEEKEKEDEERPTLARALAIVRFIEAITELGAVPAPGSLYGFAEVATPYAVGHFQNSEFTWDSRGKEEEEEKKEGDEVEDERRQGEREENQMLSTSVSVSASAFAEPSLTMPDLRLQVVPPPPRNGALLRGMLSHATSAGDLLRSVRDIQPPQQQRSESSESGGGGGGKSREKEEEDEVHVWMSASPDMEQPTSLKHEEEEDYAGRTSALQRLAQIFSWRSAGSGDIAAAAAAVNAEEPEEEEEEEISLPATPMNPFSGAASPSTGAHDLLSGFTPVQSYLESRRRRLAAATGAATATAAAPNGSGSAEYYLTEQPSLAHHFERTHTHEITSNSTSTGGVAQPQPQTTAAAAAPPSAAIFRAGISPELMREALDMEAAEIAGMDPTGSLVVDVLSKKLARMAAKEKRRQARRQRQLQLERRREEHEQQQRQKQKHITFAETGLLPHNITTAVDESVSAPRPTSAAARAEHHAESSIWSRLVILFHDPSILSFFTIATLLGFGHGVIGTFLFMYLKHLGAGEGLMGWVLLANALPELPVFYFFGTILKTVGMDTLLIGSTAVLSLRLAAYSLFNTTTGNFNLNIFGLRQLPVEWMLLLETLHAITYAVGWSACALNASKIAPPGLESTTQAMFQGLWSGIGAGTGGLVGGVLYHWKGPDALFLCSSAVIAVGCCVSGVVLGLQHKKTRYQRKHGSVANLQLLDD